MVVELRACRTKLAVCSTSSLVCTGALVPLGCASLIYAVLVLQSELHMHRRRSERGATLLVSGIEHRRKEITGYFVIMSIKHIYVVTDCCLPIIITYSK